MSTCDPSKGPTRRHTLALATLWICVPYLGAPSNLEAQERLVEGLWGSPVTTPDHPSWRIEDRIFQGGPRFGYDYLKDLLGDPANGERPLTDLVAEMRASMLEHVRNLVLVPPSAPVGPPNAPVSAVDAADDPATRCAPLDPGRIMMSPRPFSIDVDASEVVIHHEEENTVRRLPLGASNGDVSSPSRFGAPIAHFEGETLVVESTGILPMSIPLGVTTTTSLRIVERYAPDENDMNRLEFELTFDDPSVLREPLVLMSPRVRIEGQIFVDPPCELSSLEFEPGESQR